jgi:uncharacterized protein (TIGR01370 family)
MCQPIFSHSTVAFFYGHNPPIPQLCFYDILVVDSTADFNPQECESLNQTYAYVSVGEVGKDALYLKDIQKNWIIGKNTAWNNNPVIDQTNPDWQAFFIQKLITPLWKKGYRGFYLDTLDSYRLANQNPQLQQKQIAGMVRLILKIKENYPEAKLILNRGFELLPQVRQHINAVTIESLYHAWNQQKKIYVANPRTEQNRLWIEINKIRALQLPIIIIDYLPPDQKAKAQLRSDKLSQQGFIPWITDKTLQKIYLNNPREKTPALPRKILLLYTNETKLPLRLTSPLRFLGPILEYMGYIPHYQTLTNPQQLPKDNLKNSYAGIVLWLDTQDARNTFLIQWVKKQIAANIPLVFLNSFGVPIDAKALTQLGISRSEIKNTQTNLQIVKKDPNFIGFEVAPSKTPYDFYPIHATGSQVLLQLKNSQQQTEDAVAITAWGGYALYPYVIQFLPNNYALWVINPFTFFHQALKLNDFPIPDTTTENGRRLMSVHIDGDGFADQAKWLGGGFAATELRDHILKKFPIPTSVSVITGEIAPNGTHPKHSKHLIQIARSIFSLPWVESASHSFSHPFHWQASTYKTNNYTGVEPYEVKIPNYSFNLATEINGSIDFINQMLVPNHRQCQLFFWSGAADPSVAALQMTQQKPLLNINGVNDTCIDNQHPSLTGIRPMGLELTGHYQVFSPIDMDFYYMNHFKGPLYGFEKVIQTLQLTNQPRRFKPIDLYYHIYSVSNHASMQALIKVYRWALSQSVMNIYISDYIKKVLDYYQMKIYPYHGAWLIYSKGDLRELRSSRRLGYPDLLHSQNVIGFKTFGEDLYIHLGPYHLSHLKYQKQKPSEPYLMEANARVIAFYRQSKQLMLRLQGYMPVEFTLANTNQCQVVSETALKTSDAKNGNIRYQSSKDSVEIHINC